MEYQETTLSIVSTFTNRGPLHHHRFQGHHEGIYHTSWLSKYIRSCSMRYKPDIVVSVISIFEAFEFVASITGFYYVIFSWTLCSFPCFTLVVDIAP
jgi:hypothetical protein